MSIGRLQTSPSDSRRRFDDECNYFFFSLPLFSLSRPKGKSDTFSLLSIQGERKRGGQKADTRFIVALRLYKSFAKVRQFAFSSRQRCGGGTPRIIFLPSILPSLFFSPLSPSSTIFSSRSALSLRFFLSFPLSSSRWREDRGVSFYANSSSRERELKGNWRRWMTTTMMIMIIIMIKRIRIDSARIRSPRNSRHSSVVALFFF